MLQPKKVKSDKLLKDLYKKQQSLEKIDEGNQFKPNYVPQSLKYQKQRENLDNRKTELKVDSSTTKDKKFNKDIYDQKEWDAKKWGYAEDVASIAELGNFIPHPVAQGIGKAGIITSAALSARKVKLAYDNKDYLNMGLNLGMMGLSAGLGSKSLSRSTPKLSKLDSFERTIAPKSFESNIINGIEIGRNKINVPSYINILNQKSGQSAGNLLLNRGALGTVGIDLNTDFSTEQNENTQKAMGGNLNNNMRRYAQGGDLTQFNEGGTHEQNPLGGVPIGNNNSVEQGETKQDNFVYSNRIILDNNIVSQYNLPKSLVGKSVADATKLIDNKFKGRNDKISQSTKNSMLSKIAEAQEAMKPQEPEMEQPQEGIEQQGQQDIQQPNQMWDGGFKQSTIGQGFGKDATGAQQSAALGAGVGVLGSVLDLGKTAFGKPAQDTTGLAASDKVDSFGMISGSAMKGAAAGAALGPIGAGVGAVIGGAAGFLGSNKAKKAAIENTTNFAINTNKKYSDNYYAMGGEIEDPTSKVATNTGIGVTPVNNDMRFDTKQIVQYQPGVTSGRDGTSGFYLYNKRPTEAGFDYKTNREFVRNENMADLQRTPQWQSYIRNKTSQGNQFGDGGPITGFGADGKWIKPPPPTFDPLTKPFSVPVGKDALIRYQLSKGLTKAQATGNYGSKTKAFVAADILKNQVQETDPSKMIILPKDTPFVEPTGVRAAFEKYADENATVQSKTFAGKSLDYLNKNAGNIARYAPVAANAYQLSQLKKPQGESLDRLGNRYRPEYVDEAQLQNIANQTMNNSVNAIGQSGASQGQLRSSIIGSQLQRTKAISDSYGQAAAQNRAINDVAQSFNASIDQTNLQQSNSEKDINARDQAAYRNEKSKYISAIGEGVGDIGKEQVQKKIITNTTGYTYDGKYVKDVGGNIVTDPDTGEPMTGEKMKTLQSTKNVKKQALGGYLIKNKIK